MLFMALSSIHLTDHKDEIMWKWEVNGQFSVASTYNCQFHGVMSKFPAPAIWRSLCEPRSKIFSKLVMHNKVLTADNMLKKSWPCNPNCALCFCMEETTSHLLTECNFTEATWNFTAGTFDLPNYQTMAATGGPEQWLNHLQKMGSKQTRRKMLEFWLLSGGSYWKKETKGSLSSLNLLLIRWPLGL
jgi:hypothetical protein